MKIEAFDYKQKGRDARELAAKMRVVVKVFTTKWEEDGDRWELFKRIEEVLRGDFGDGEAWVRSVALVTTARKPSAKRP